jgi:hypothetical protein
MQQSASQEHAAAAMVVRAEWRRGAVFAKRATTPVECSQGMTLSHARDATVWHRPGRGDGRVGSLGRRDPHPRRFAPRPLPRSAGEVNAAARRGRRRRRRTGVSRGHDRTPCNSLPHGGRPRGHRWWRACFAKTRNDPRVRCPRAGPVQQTASGCDPVGRRRAASCGRHSLFACRTEQVCGRKGRVGAENDHHISQRWRVTK